jgi:hypothetical protein
MRLYHGLWLGQSCPPQLQSLAAKGLRSLDDSAGYRLGAKLQIRGFGDLEGFG